MPASASGGTRAVRKLARAMALGGSALILALGSPAPARTPPVAPANLLDQVQIKDLIVDYYTSLTAHERHDIAQFFTEDAVLDVNGAVFSGRATIQHLFDSETDTRIEPTSSYNVLLTNPRIVVTGNTATMKLIWTGYLNDNKYTAPRLVEQGTEEDELVKQNGIWMIKSRKIVNQGGRPTWTTGQNARN